MKTAMQELKYTIRSMIDNGGTEEDLYAVINHIDNTFLEKEKQQIIDAVKSLWSVHELPDYEQEGEDYYNKTFKTN